MRESVHFLGYASESQESLPAKKRKGFLLTEILFRVIDLKVLNSYLEPEIQEPPAGLGFKITRTE